jgi:hypothetical protein
LLRSKEFSVFHASFFRCSRNFLIVIEGEPPGPFLILHSIPSGPVLIVVVGRVVRLMHLSWRQHVSSGDRHGI